MKQPFAKTMRALSIVMPTICAQQASAAASESVLHSFAEIDGAFPQGSLVADRAGNLYGTTPLGGDDGFGAVFVIDTHGAFSVIHSFQGAPNDGSGPNNRLAIDDNGILYGTTGGGGTQGSASGGGTVFQLVPASGGAWTENILYNFCSKKHCADGDRPAASVVLAEDGMLYGTTQFGGRGAAFADRGTVFRLEPPREGGGWKETVLHDFCNQPDCADGAYPFTAQLLLSNSGLLYGTTNAGGHSGTLYSLATDGGGFQILHDFGATSGDGTRPFDGVIAGPNGMLYGMTPTGGANGSGSAYSYDPSSSAYEMFHSFCVETGDACFPEGGFVLLDGRNGPRLYGMSPNGGASNSGAIFKFVPPARPGARWKEKPVYSFCSRTDCGDGRRPAGDLLRLKGAFYGTASRGGDGDMGVVFRYGRD